MTDWVIDLDGVMWRGRRPIAGSAEAVGDLLARGDRVLFCTNNSLESGDRRTEHLVAQGIPAGFDVVTSADAVCALVEPGERIVALGGPGLLDALSQHGAHVTAAADVDVGVLLSGLAAGAAAPFAAVVMGLTREFDYQQMDVAAAAVRAGARLLASNGDTTFPGADGVHVGTGALVAAVEAATGERAAIAGKPWEPMARLISQRLGLPGPTGASDDAAGWADRPDVVVVGDRGNSDGRLAEVMGQPFALVLSGVTTGDDMPLEVPVQWMAPTLADLVADLPGAAVRAGHPGGASAASQLDRSSGTPHR